MVETAHRDRVNHDRLMKSVGLRIADKQLLKLI